MPNTYSKIYIHIIFSVKHRDKLISPEWKEKLHKYITGIVKNNGTKLIAINSMPDHIHLLLELKPDIKLSDLVKEIKRCSTNYINNEMKFTYNFNWQDGYAALSYSYSQIENVYNYIINQEKHHRIKTFHEEYEEFLKKYKIEYDKKYLFSFEQNE